MVEDTAKNTIRNISNGVLLQVDELSKMDKHRKTKSKDKMARKTVERGNTENVRNYSVMFCSELLGTGLLLYLGCMGCIPEVDSPPAFHHMSSLSFGLVILLIIQAFGHISGAHLNPAVTLAAVFLKVTSPVLAIVYVAAQFIGAILGFALLKVSLPEEYVKPGLCLTLPHQLLTPIQAFVIETVITTSLIIVVCAVWDKRNADKPDSVPLRFGLVVAAISMVAGPLTGASMNTARTFAPAILERNFNAQWIYWTAPNLGAILGVGIYKYLFALPEEEEHSQDEVISLEDVNTTLEKSTYT